jgi:hypothetical protein
LKTTKRETHGKTHKTEKKSTTAEKQELEIIGDTKRKHSNKEEHEKLELHSDE